MFLCVRVSKSVHVPGSTPMGASSMPTVKAVRKLGHSDREPGCRLTPLTIQLRATWPCHMGRATKQETPRNIIQGRTNKLTLCRSISLTHLGPFYSGMLPICFLPMSGDRRGGNKTAEKGTKRREWPEKEGIGSEREDKWGPTRRKGGRRAGQAKVKWTENKKPGERTWRFHSSRRNLTDDVSSLRACSEQNLQMGLSVSLLHERTRLIQQSIKQTAQYQH